MQDDDIDRILSEQEEILPSSGFVASVMDAVRSEAAAPPPIPFPWKRALPVLALAAAAVIVTVVVGIVGMAHPGAQAPSSAVTTREMATSLLSILWPGQSAAGWSAVGLLMAFISVKLSMRLAVGRS